MSKLKIIDKKSIKSIKSELELLSNLESPYIVNMHFAFQDKENLYLVMDFLSGGDLRFHISRHKKFSEEQTRFFICGLILSLEYIHSNNIIHRDIKPENLVLENNGYLRVTDFGIAKKIGPNPHVETSGTPGYMAPEVMKSLNHSFCADFFAVGVMGYEFMKGERPYLGKNRKEIKEEILKRQAEIKIEDLNENWTKESADFINKLLMREPENRMGYKSINELKEHPWLKYYPWDLIKDKKLPSPFIPENKDNFDKRYCENEEKIGEETNQRYQDITDENKIEILFNNYYFNENEDKRRTLKKKLEINNKINKKKITTKNNNDRNYKINISKLLKKKIDIYNKTIYKLEKERENIKMNPKINKINNVNKRKVKKFKHIKSGSVCETKNGNMIYINFNINNNTNNNIIGNGNNFNNFFISNKNQNMNDNLNNTNAQTERIKYFLQNNLYNDNQIHNETINNTNNINNDSLFLGLNGFNLTNINTPFRSSLKKIFPKKVENNQSKNKNKNNSVLIKNLSKQYISHLNIHKYNTNNNSKSRYTFSHSYGKKDFEKIYSKKMKEDANKTISSNNELSYRANFKKINKIPCGRISQHIIKSEYNLNQVKNKETLTINSQRRNSKQKLETIDKYNTNINNGKNNIEIKYSIQEIINTDRNNSNKKKLNYIYSKKSMLERKHNQFHFPIVKSNSYKKSNQINKKCNLSKSKEKGSQLNINPQMNKINKVLKFNEGEIYKNKSFRNTLNIFKQEEYVEKIKVNKNVYIN